MELTSDSTFNLANIISARAFLSFSYGFLNVLVSLYLHHIGYSLFTVGVILGSAIVISSILTFFMAMLADHYGRKSLLIVLYLIFAVSAFGFLVSKEMFILILLSGLGSFTGSGGGPIGSGGAFGAVQTALITEFTEKNRFSRVLSTASAVGLLASSAGSFLIDVVERIGGDVYRLFYLAGIMGIVGMLITVFLNDNGIRSRKLLPSISWKKMIRLSIPTIPNGIGAGFVSPIFSLWFHLRFGISSGEIGVIFGISNIFVLIFMIVIPRIIRSESELNAIVWTRAASSMLLVALAFIPFLQIAALVYILRQGLQMGAVPVRQSFSMGIVDSTERATASGVTSMTRTGFSAVSPPLAGDLLSISSIYPPLIGGIITAADPLLYYMLFRDSFRRKS
ncbi:MFS transporter [Thermoplasma acidophilum]|uniref:MFS transporter n=1 Tax=Thermoplasma acidophilum TaxID=2303 RepID=UPI00064F21A8|nr:MFS transporter [Thermoplasma acidophilum]MCY0852145.1 MFS transporter [Thermoplasma acidophilum]